MYYLDRLNMKELIRLKQYLENFKSIEEVKILVDIAVKERKGEDDLNMRLLLNNIPHSPQAEEIFKEKNIKTMKDLLDAGPTNIAKGPVTADELKFMSKMYDMRTKVKKKS